MWSEIIDNSFLRPFAFLIALKLTLFGWSSLSVCVCVFFYRSARAWKADSALLGKLSLIGAFAVFCLILRFVVGKTKNSFCLFFFCVYHPCAIPCFFFSNKSLPTDRRTCRILASWSLRAESGNRSHVAQFVYLCFHKYFLVTSAGNWPCTAVKVVEFCPRIDIIAKGIYFAHLCCSLFPSLHGAHTHSDPFVVSLHFTPKIEPKMNHPKRRMPGWFIWERGRNASKRKRNTKAKKGSAKPTFRQHHFRGVWWYMKRG